MEIRNVFETRKSIRSYTGEAIPDVVLERILKVANISPVARGLYENVHLTIITNKEYLAKIEENAGEALNAQGTKFLYGAPMLILVSANADNNVAHSNAAILASNMHLEAVANNVGSCLIWGCIAPLAKNPELVKALGIPDGFTPCCGVALGMSEEQYEKRDIPEGRIAINRI